MRTLVIGDIHGCSAAMDHVLNMVQPSADDTIITLGDYVDRGPDTKGVIDRLLFLQGHCRLIPLAGNHEIMMLQSVHDPVEEKEWRRHGAEEALRSYAPDKPHPTLADVPDPHWHFIRNDCLTYWQTPTHLFAHAGMSPEILPEEQSDADLFWNFLSEDRAPHFSGKTLLCGHTAQRSGVPLHLGHTICIDTYAHGGGFLSCLELESGRLYQASQSGVKRESRLRLS